MGLGRASLQPVSPASQVFQDVYRTGVDFRQASDSKVAHGKNETPGAPTPARTSGLTVPGLSGSVRPGIDDAQANHDKIAYVAGNSREVMMKRCRGNQAIHNRQPPAFR